MLKIDLPFCSRFLLAKYYWISMAANILNKISLKYIWNWFYWYCSAVCKFSRNWLCLQPLLSTVHHCLKRSIWGQQLLHIELNKKETKSNKIYYCHIIFCCFFPVCAFSLYLLRDVNVFSHFSVFFLCVVRIQTFDVLFAAGEQNVRMLLWSMYVLRLSPI